MVDLSERDNVLFSYVPTILLTFLDLLKINNRVGSHCSGIFRDKKQIIHSQGNFKKKHATFIVTLTRICRLRNKQFVLFDRVIKSCRMAERGYWINKVDYWKSPKKPSLGANHLESWGVPLFFPTDSHP